MQYRPLTVGALMLTLVAPAFAQPGNGQSEQQERQAAEALLAKFDEAYNRHDAAGIAALFTAKTDFLPARPLPPLGAVITERQGVQKFFTEAFKTFDHQSEKLVDAGSLGSAGLWYVAEVHLTGRGARGPLRLDGHAGVVVVRSGGSWHIRMATTNGGPPRPTTAATGTSQPAK